MAEDSAYWAGTTLGDAASTDIWAAPYTDTEYADIWSKLLASNDNQGFVIAGQNNNLRIYASTPPAMTVEVASGTVFIRGRLYENTAAKTLTISANSSGDPRLDRVIARVTTASQTIRLAVLVGTPAAAPALPTLTQTAATYEISLGYIYVANAAASITDADIHDEREFTCTSANFNDTYGVPNLVVNSEFMGFSQLSGGATTNPPDGWSLVATPSDVANYTRPSQMTRGRAVQVTTNAANEGISQTFNVKASTMYSIKLLTRVTAGDVGSIVVTTNSAAPGTITRYTRRTATWIEEKIFYMTEADATTMTVQLLGLNNGDIIQYGQVLAVEGYVPGPFREFKEFIMFTNYMWDDNWNGDLADYKSTGVTTIDYAISYAGAILAKTKALYIFVYTLETVSTANPCGASVRPTGTSINLIATNLKGCVLNFQPEEKLEFVYLDNTLTLDYSIVAGGVLSLLPVIYIRGMII